MQKNTLPFQTLLFSALCSQLLYPSISTKEDPIPPLQIALKHIEGKGVGYHEGYSTLEGFFAPTHKITGNWIPFIDARMHLFNNGLPAANAGVGIRYLSKRAWGLNTYYDFRKTNHSNYNQVSLGLESLGKIWDFRINGYLPVGGKLSSPFDIKFGHFSGHSMILKRKKEFALKSIQAEFATHALKIRHTPAYIAAGPYYLTGFGKTTWGGKARLAFDFFTYFTAEGIASYDNLFKDIYQGRISLNIPLGPKKPIPSSKKERKRIEYAHQRVDRNEIIPTDKGYFDAVAIDPATQEPYVFWFVDNTSHSNGTFESPYPILAQAESKAQEYDVIYVFPGDGTDRNLDTGFVMKKGQRLLGTGVSQIFPTQQKNSIVDVKVSAMTTNYPLITLATSLGYNTGVITLSNSCEVSGIHITSDSNFLGKKLAAIMGGPTTTIASPLIGVENASLHNNIIEGTYYEGGIYLHNSKGSILIADNTLTTVTASNSITCINDISHVKLSTTISDNTITTSSGGGIYFQNTSGITISKQNILIAFNEITDSGRDGISIINNGDIAPSTLLQQYIQILDNTVSNSGENGIFILNNKTIDIALQTALIQNNTVSTCSNGRGIYFFNTGTLMTIGSQKIEILDNAVTSPSLEGIYVLNYNDITIGTQRTLISSNTVNKSKTTGLSFGNNLTIISQDQLAIIKSNVITNSSDGGIYLQNQGPSTSQPLCLLLRDNTIDTSVSFGITIGTFSASTTNVTLDKNTTANTSSAISLGITSNNTSTLCANITENTFDKNIVFLENGTSQLFIAPLVDNTFVDITGTYTPVPSGTCDCGLDSLFDFD
ncbi:MAG: right-handed parallel beta-helix repeat-containing protein [Chlamydiota bacterium]